MSSSELASILAVSDLSAEAPVTQALPSPSPATMSATTTPMATFRFNDTLTSSPPSGMRFRP
nr:MAG TPA: hypothetical protein [Caudoviricetes sp.]